MAVPIIVANPRVVARENGQVPGIGESFEGDVEALKVVRVVIDDWNTVLELRSYEWFIVTHRGVQ